MSILTTAVILSGILLGMWGLFHQLIVGGAVTMDPDIDERTVRLFLMSWITQGAYLSLTGFLPVVLLVFYQPYDEAVLTTCLVVAIALLILSLHVFATSRKFFITPITIGLTLQTIHSLILFVYYFAHR
mgnify:CR=1 FL=1